MGNYAENLMQGSFFEHLRRRVAAGKASRLRGHERFSFLFWGVGDKGREFRRGLFFPDIKRIKTKVKEAMDSGDVSVFEPAEGIVLVRDRKKGYISSAYSAYEFKYNSKFKDSEATVIKHWRKVSRKECDNIRRKIR